MNAASLRIAEQSLRNVCMNEWHSRSCLGMPFFWQLGRRSMKRQGKVIRSDDQKKRLEFFRRRMVKSKTKKKQKMR